MNAFPTDFNSSWLTEWIEFGLREFETYLDKHRRFDEYYVGRADRTKREAAP